MTGRFPMFFVATAFSFGVAQADVVHLKNGRRMEGEVTRRTPDAIYLQVRAGSILLPRSMVARVEEKQRPQDEFADRLRRVDANDPEALDTLALWASSRGLGQQSQNLTAQANGIRLQMRVDAVRGTRRARDWLEVYHWAKHRQLSGEVQEWLLGQAEDLEPQLLAVRMARREQALERERVEAEATERVEVRLDYRERRSARIAEREREQAEREEAARLAQLEAQVEAQQARIDELEERGPRRIIRRRRRPRRGVSTGVILPPGTGLIKAEPLPLPPGEAPPPPVSIRGR